ncbi:MAG TPA: PHP domain-containing protein [Chloroflexota bacterium]|nr:PHP domain-containing protein [Chloroflexota bacterium]
MTPQKIDLHLHTNKSDGRLSPTELVRLAHKGGVRRMALTDHDTTAGLEEAMAEGAVLGIEVIPGVELGTDSRSGDLHMLGLFLEYQDTAFQETMARFREGRVARVHTIVANLAEVGVNISVDRVFEIAGEASVGRPHVAQALLEAGYIKSMPEAFEKWLAYGGPGDVPRDKLSPEDAIGLIHAVGGLAVVAHPYEGKNVLDQLPGLAAAGLDGVETYYQSYGPDRVQELLGLCAKLGILPTGGSDFHGFPLAGHEEVVNYPGSVEIPSGVLDALEARRAERFGAR